MIYTHSHADHVHGLDDLRMIVFNMRQRLPVWADGQTQNDLLNRFGYAFVQPPGSAYPAILDLNAIDGDVTVDGAGGPITFHPFEVTPRQYRLPRFPHRRLGLPAGRLGHSRARVADAGGARLLGAGRVCGAHRIPATRIWRNPSTGSRAQPPGGRC